MEEKSEGKISRSLYLKVVAGCALLITILIIASVTVTIIASKTTEYTTPEKLVQSTTTTEVQTSVGTTRTTNAPTTSTTVKEIVKEPETIPTEKPAGPDAPVTPVTPVVTDGVKTCDTKLCIDIAARLLENMNPSVDPCDDFYENACGSYSKNYDTIETMGIRYYRLFTKHISATIRSKEKHKSSAVELVKGFYKNCQRNQYLLHTKSPYIQYFEERALKLFGATENDFDLTNALKVTMGEGLDILFARILPTEMPFGLNLPNISVMFGSGKINSTILLFKFGNKSQNYINQFEEYDHFLKSNNQLTVQEITEQTEHPIEIEKMEQLVPQIRWRELIRSLFPKETDYNPTNSVTYVEYKVFSTPGFGEYLSNKTYMRDHFYYNYVLKSLKRMTETCQEMIYDLFPRILLAAYAEEHYNKKNFKKIREVFEAERKSWRKMFNDSDYLDDNTKKKLIEKLDMIKFSVLALDEGEDFALFDKQVETLDIKGKSFLDQLIEVRRWKTKLTSDSYVTHPERIFNNETNVFTAQYVNLFNSITVSTPILNYPLFDADAPDFFNYGSSGFILAHEIGHAFGSSNRHFSRNLYIPLKWNTTASMEYEKRSKCLVDQFSEIEWKGYDTKVNGTFKLRENQADNTGIKVAYETYKRIHPNNKPVTLPGLEKFTEDKLFYYSSAMWMCNVPPSQHHFKSSLTDVHAFSKFRANSFKNDPNFAKTFNCKEGSNMNMNPVDRCAMF